jgi:hypothetical protein
MAADYTADMLTRAWQRAGKDTATWMMFLEAKARGEHTHLVGPKDNYCSQDKPCKGFFAVKVDK